MMGERRVMQEALFYSFNLERHVPKDHLLRKIDRWPAAGSVDTEIGCFRRREARDAEAKVQWRVQDRGGPPGG
jgi:hypothetical protein